MKIELADSYGFCFGVKRAIRIAENTKDSATYGELIHNAEEINRLKEHFNVKTLNTMQDLENENSIIIRTHGITKKDLDAFKSQNKKIIDATCPFVSKPQNIVEKMSKDGYDIVIFGDKNHPEVKGIMSYALKNVFVVLNTDELMNKKISNKVAVVSQTTKKVEEFTKIVSFLITRSKEVRVFNTICNATLENQKAVEKLAKKADVMIIIGGKNSSNTKQLYLISKQICSDSYHIENESELEKEWFKGKNLCGISAGASTPDWIIANVSNKIRELS
ncbi:4-hydroxy-3-methylbut-2-enyl diphosphate reductase [Campylobacter ureolyticus]|uniref:4-hydroxy-3-methylbut-2-enyl diphosphate reductase n=1 Tax=Campylobacter ureolyticus TaxID=827 RepID=A0A2I1NC49_9BACT|nr:4-hydroxy-3-methylbut-2-enyl diphosphate reductase [Campylobacter ureolyticus]MCR8699392.1 4-hydroxy-3-methylbut-2-enyl diphosphate reductase [Campylobacter ureolyticus]MCZ6104815.1 4-hydroxy-3-methylbut-2-enyl diphosphate reductase [Campylobacter ureolyticus]MCZ6150218.1 4-hydroxy-3-methylbut-2-enyl diphosphate reductase [Campylobacter ureolyticus]MCZ6157431.1 4-hydroxy-3-methylbut-2-enyl diphosphate reductase [Campylobacter ureolyticus]PKZ29977.1 4-hydroxy-3-methylbut-2-enyl diphosphate r